VWFVIGVAGRVLPVAHSTTHTNLATGTASQPANAGYPDVYAVFGSIVDVMS
jgi:hypothetical protein